jgi:thioredoxin-like negative regulator of GroEL
VGAPWADQAAHQPAAPQAANAQRERAAARARRIDERVAEDLKVGDRLFRAKEFPRAERRYREAAQANPNLAEPHLRLAQVSIARKDYAQAARHIHDAQTAEPGWQLMAQPRDIQNLFGDPADFTRTLADLESHLQANPEDRDGWLVLGTELYLTGRTERAHDAFLRLTDRKPDPTLAGFLDMMPPAPAP